MHTLNYFNSNNAYVILEFAALNQNRLSQEEILLSAQDISLTYKYCVNTTKSPKNHHFNTQGDIFIYGYGPK